MLSTGMQDLVSVRHRWSHLTRLLWCFQHFILDPLCVGMAAGVSSAEDDRVLSKGATRSCLTGLTNAVISTEVDG